MGDADLRVLRVRCDRPHSTRGPLGEAQRRLEELLGEASPLIDQARERMVSGLRRRLLGDVAEPTVASAFVASCNRLGKGATGHAALVLDAIETADEDTIDTLEEVLSPPERVTLPLVIVFREMPTAVATHRG